MAADFFEAVEVEVVVVEDVAVVAGAAPMMKITSPWKQKPTFLIDCTRQKIKFWGQSNLHQKSSSFHIVITSYQLVITDFKFFNRIKWQYLVLDEAQAIKSSSSQRWKMLLEFKCRNRLLLSGTPIQNTMAELWSLLHFVMPTLFDSHEEFDDWFSKDIESSAESKSQVDESKFFQKSIFLLSLTNLESFQNKSLDCTWSSNLSCYVASKRTWKMNWRKNWKFSNIVLWQSAKSICTTGSKERSGSRICYKVTEVAGVQPRIQSLQVWWTSSCNSEKSVIIRNYSREETQSHLLSWNPFLVV